MIKARELTDPRCISSSPNLIHGEISTGLLTPFGLPHLQPLLRVHDLYTAITIGSQAPLHSFVCPKERRKSFRATTAEKSSASVTAQVRAPTASREMPFANMPILTSDRNGFL